MTDIARINSANYHMFEDMVYWRMAGNELTNAEKRANREKDFSLMYNELEYPGFYSYGALCDGRFIGWISMMYTPKIGPRWKKGMIYVDELWVAPEYRNRGIGKELMEKAFECQRSTGAVEVRVYVGSDNTAALKLYRSCGMRDASQATYMRSSES